MSATLAGSVTLEDGRKNLVVRFFTPVTHAEVMKACSPTAADGSFTIYGITPGTYDVGVKADSSQSLLATGKVFTEGNTTTINFGVLPEGDLDGDDYIGFWDYCLLTGHYDTFGPCYGYPGNWLMPVCPTPPPAGVCYGYVIG